MAQSDRDSGDSYSEDADSLTGIKDRFGTVLTGPMTQAHVDARDKYNHADQMVRVGAGFAATGVLLFVSGVVLTSLRTSKRKQRREMQRIDNELRSLVSRASAEPWFGVRGRGAARGLSGSLRF